ncbi:MAG: TIGR04013 family B12-binding domain/radical SAM domain-containing protein [Candidatus Hodarchaeales archaeon]|jgi:B12-binding domain/radical SAM domain protein
MLTPTNSFVVLLYWTKNTWYSLSAIAACLQKFSLPYEIIKGDVISEIQARLNKGSFVIYGESTRSMGLSDLECRLKSISQNFSSSHVITVVGGPHASGAPQEILQMGANYVVVGEGEQTFPKLVRVIISKGVDYKNFSNLNGIAYSTNRGDFIQTSPRRKIILDDFCPYSDNDFFPLHPPIELMRGCAFRCRFCQVPYMYGNPRFRSVDTICKIVEHYIKHFTPLKDQIDIRFISPNSLGYMEKKRGQTNTQAITSLINQVTKYDIRLFFGTFPSEIRPEYVTDEILKLFDKLANRQVSVGFQSGSDRVLKNMRRGHTVDDGLQAFKIITSHGFTPIFDFLLGSPSETIEEQWQTLDLIRELGGKSKVRLHYFMSLPGTPWENSNPAPLDPDIQSEIGRLTQAEIVGGEFARQLQFYSNEK